MRILAYEYVTGGGLWHDDVGESACMALLAEGRAMLSALLADLVSIRIEASTSGESGTPEVICLQDVRYMIDQPPGVQTLTILSAGDELAQLAQWAGRVDGMILIAPELGGRLLERARLVHSYGGRLWSPDPGFVELTTNKRQTADQLEQHGVPVPLSVAIEPGQCLPQQFPYPGVLKPVDGVGSLLTRLVKNNLDISAERFPRHQVESADGAESPVSMASALFGEGRMEQYHAGMPASVMALCGLDGHVTLEPCRQFISDDGLFQYRGGQLPLDRPLAARAQKLADATLAALPRTVGFVGIDMILGKDADGRSDVVLEVNPRLTTSYVGLRRCTEENLANAMIQLAMGRTLSGPIPFNSHIVRFDAEGHISVDRST